jgi:hypothetical protein
MHEALVGSPQHSVHFRSNIVFDAACYACLLVILPLDKTYFHLTAFGAVRGGHLVEKVVL